MASYSSWYSQANFNGWSDWDDFGTLRIPEAVRAPRTTTEWGSGDRPVPVDFSCPNTLPVVEPLVSRKERERIPLHDRPAPAPEVPEQQYADWSGRKLLSGDDLRGAISAWRSRWDS